MSIGPKDGLEEFIVKRYAQKQVNMPQLVESAIDPDKMMVCMNNYAVIGKCMAAVSRNISSLQYALNAANADYSKRKERPHVISIFILCLFSFMAV